MNANSIPANGARGEARRWPAHSLLDRTLYRHLSVALLGAVTSGAVYFAAAGSWYRAAALGALVLLGAGFMVAKARLPSAFTLLFVLAAAINLAGYLFDLWTSPLWFDEFVHAFTSFTVMAAIGWMLLARTTIVAQAETGKLLASVIAIGLGLGLAWEGFEWVIGIIGSPADTIVDLLMDVIGALAAGIFCGWVGRREWFERNAAR